MKHTEVPHQLTEAKIGETCKLKPGDKIVYAAIRRYMNKDSRECYPSITTICGLLKSGRAKVIAAIDRLCEAGFLQKRRSVSSSGSTHGTKSFYYFPLTKFDEHFEKFTDDFLDMDLQPNVKEYYMDIQRYLYGCDTGVGRCNYSNAELSRLTG